MHDQYVRICKNRGSLSDHINILVGLVNPNVSVLDELEVLETSYNNAVGD